MIFIHNATLVTMNANREVFTGDILIEGNCIREIGQNIKKPKDAVILDATDKYVLPGFVQVHTHLCQTLFRNLAENLELLDWLEQKIWPLEGAHTYESMKLSAKFGILELLKGGTTTILDMASVHHTDAVFEACLESGIRASIGKALMDAFDSVPSSLKEGKEKALEESLELFRRWHGQEGRLFYHFAPRFVPSCTEELLRVISHESKRHNLLVHTHACENKKEVAYVKKERGKNYIEYLEDLKLTGEKTILAHCVWLSQKEFEILQHSRTRVAHCPSSNLKLGSGIAEIPRMLEKGILVGLGADGAPCNNNLDMFQEMKLAYLIQKSKFGVHSLSAEKVLEMATINGARILGLDKKIGSLEKGKIADLFILDLNKPHNVSGGDVYSQIVASARSSDVETVLVNGKVLIEKQKATYMDEAKLISQCKLEIPKILQRAGI